MDDLKINKIQRFMQDKVMVEAVFGLIKDSFLKQKGIRDIQIMASERMAIELLEESRREFAKYDKVENRDSGGIKQVGL